MGKISVILIEDTLKVSGRIFFDDVLSLLNFCLEKTSGLNLVKIDLSQLLSSNSSVLIFIISYIRNAKKKKQVVKFLNIPDSLLELSKVYNLKKIIYEDITGN